MSRSPHIPSAYFDHRAADYAAHAVVQAEAAARLLERLDGLSFQPQRVLEIGCADGRQCAALHRRWPKARIIGLDASAGMLKQARQRRRWWRRDFELLRADGSRLPLADGSIDLVYANLSLGWLGDVHAALLDWRRVLRSGGLLLASVYGPDTLRDWRMRIGLHSTMMSLPDVQAFGSALVRAGFSEPVLDTDWLTTVHANPSALLAELRGGALLPAAAPGLGRALQRAINQRLDADVPEAECRAAWEIVSASAWAPEPGQAIRRQGGEEASIPVSAIGIRRRETTAD